MTDLTAELIAHIHQVTAVSPGDTLVIGLTGRVSMQQMDELTKAMRPLKESAPGVEVVFVAGVEQMAKVRPDYADPEFEQWFHKHLRMQGATCPCHR